MAELTLQSSRSPDAHYPLFEGWTGARTLVVVYIAAEVTSKVLSGGAGVLLFLAWNIVMGPLLTLLTMIMTLRASALPGMSVWRRLIILSSLTVPLGIMLMTFTGGRGVARFFNLY